MAQLSIFRAGRLEGVFHLPDKPVLIGRTDGMDIQLLDSRVSRRHAVIRESVAGYIIQDLDTKNGTFVNEEAVDRSLLFHSDAIVIGGYTLEFVEEEEVDASTRDSGFFDPLPEQRPPAQRSFQEPAPSARSTAYVRAEEPLRRVDRVERRGEAAPHARETVDYVGQSGPIAQAPMSAPQTHKKSNVTLDFSSSEFDSVEDPDSAPPGNADDLLREARSNAEVSARSDRSEIRETTEGVSKVHHVPEPGTTTFGFSDRDRVRLRGTGVGTLFIVRRIDDAIEVRAGSSLRPLLLNGAPVVSAEAFPGDVFEVGGRSFEIGMSLGEEAAPGAETVLGIDAVALEAAIHARLGDSVVVAARPSDPETIGPGSSHVDSGRYETVSEEPEWEDEWEDEWKADSLSDAPMVSAAVATAEEGTPSVMEDIVVETVSETDVPFSVGTNTGTTVPLGTNSGTTVPLGTNSGTMPRVSDTLRMRALGHGRRTRRPDADSTLLPPVTATSDEE